MSKKKMFIGTIIIQLIKNLTDLPILTRNCAGRYHDRDAYAV